MHRLFVFHKSKIFFPDDSLETNIFKTNTFLRGLGDEKGILVSPAV
jgi:hypothetical protein